LLNASGKSAGQSVDHFHIHIIPRKLNDDNDLWPVCKGAKYEIAEMHEKLKIK
jgi:histidine triad (HIT) family protein